MFSIIQAAGWPIWPLLLASIIAVALIIERLITLRRIKILPPGLLSQIDSELRKGTINAKRIAELGSHSPLGRVLAAGLKNAHATREIMKEAVEEAGSAEMHQLERYLTTLGTIASVAPLMGLFGTIVGMIELFASQGPNGDPQQLAHGVSIALYNTGFGLLIAIPALIFWRHFRALVDAFILDMEQQAVKLVEIIHNQRRR